MRSVIVILLLFSIWISMEGKKNDTIPRNDTSFYVSLNEKLTIYTYGVSKFNQFEVSNNENDKALTYLPNTKFNIGLGFSYRWVDLSTTFNFKFLNNDNDIYGETTSFDIQSDLFTRRMILSGNIQSYKGFYWQNPGEYYPVWNKIDSFIIRPDIETFQVGTNIVYAFNHERFSFKSAFTRTGWQKKRAGSWLAGGFLSLYELNADSIIAPVIALSSFPVYDSICKIDALNFGGSIGYAYNYVWHRKFFINGTLMFGVASQTFLASDGEGVTRIFENNLSTKTHFRFAIGFNSEKQTFGLSAVLDSYIIRNRSVNELSNNYGKINVFYARRFDVRKRK